jgi:hypothetical protein
LIAGRDRPRQRRSTDSDVLTGGDARGQRLVSPNLKVRRSAAAPSATRSTRSRSARIDDHERWVNRQRGAFAMLVRALPEDERQVLRARLREAFAPFATDSGYELPGVAFCAVAS